MVYELPYMECPESAPIVKMGDYSHMIPYIHSNHLRFSYGTIKHGPEDRSMKFIQNIYKESSLYFLKLVYEYGYRGLLLDRFGFKDSGAELQRLYTVKLGEPLISGDNRYVFFDLHSKSIEAIGATDPQSMPTLSFTSGFYPQETDPADSHFKWNWGVKEGVIEIFNPTKYNQKVKMNGTVQLAHQGELKIFYESGNQPIYYGMSAESKGMGGDVIPPVVPQVPTGENKVTSNVTITYEVE